MTVKFTLEEKLKEVEREIGQRHRVYPKLIGRGKLRAETAQRQIAIMSAIAEDLRDKIKEGPLFRGGI